MDDQLLVKRTPQLLRHQVTEKLREAIYDLRFLPGARLIERELCELTGVSRTLIREALRELEADGLVQGSIRGPIVAKLSEYDAGYIYVVRASLEGLAGKYCALNTTPEIVATLRTAFADIERTYTDPAASGSQKLGAKDRFYHALLEGAGNPILTDLLRVLHARINLLRAAFARESRTVKSLAEIRSIISAIEKGEPEIAQQRCITHVENAAIAAFDAMKAPVA